MVIQTQIMMNKTKLSIEALKSNLYDYIDATFYLLEKMILLF